MRREGPSRNRRHASLRTRGSPKGAGAVKVGAAQRGPARPTHLAVSHLKLNGRRETETRHPRPGPWAAPAAPPQGGLREPATLAPTAGDRGRGVSQRPPRRPPRTANRPCGPRAPTRPARGPRAPAPPASSGPLRAADRNAGARREGPKAPSPPGRLSPVAGRRASAAPLRLVRPPACHLRVARRSRAPRGVGARARCRRRAAREPGPGPAHAPGSEDCKGARARARCPLPAPAAPPQT